MATFADLEGTGKGSSQLWDGSQAWDGGQLWSGFLIFSFTDLTEK